MRVQQIGVGSRAWRLYVRSAGYLRARVVCKSSRLAIEIEFPWRESIAEELRISARSLECTSHQTAISVLRLLQIG